VRATGGKTFSPEWAAARSGDGRLPDRCASIEDSETWSIMETTISVVGLIFVLLLGLVP
jgi:hypothetical protein